MTKQEFFEYCLSTYGTSPDYPFDEDFETAVLRHADNRKWYAIVMRVSRRKFSFDSDEVIDVVNLKLPTEMFGSFGAADGVYPAYHMNKLHCHYAETAGGQNIPVDVNPVGRIKRIPGGKPGMVIYHSHRTVVVNPYPDIVVDALNAEKKEAEEA